MALLALFELQADYGLLSLETTITPQSKCTDTHLVRQIGRGSMGVVRHVRCNRSGKEFAVKVAEQDHRSRLQNEFLALQSFSHPNIIQVCAARGSDTCSSAPESHYCAELLLGGSCQDRGRSGTWNHALSTAREVGRALSYLHEQSWIHRDVKPGNVVYSKGGVAKLIDFGIAIQKGNQKKSDRALTPGVGTPAYMAPEQWYLYSDECTDSIDRFALGGLLYALLVGKAPNQARKFGGCEMPSILACLHLEKSKSSNGDCMQIAMACEQLIRDCSCPIAANRISCKEFVARVDSLLGDYAKISHTALPDIQMEKSVDPITQGTAYTHTVPELLAQLATGLEPIRAGALFRLAGSDEYILLSAALAVDKFNLSEISRLQSNPRTRHSWLRMDSSRGLELHSDHALRRVSIENGQAQEDLFLRLQPCYLGPAALVMFEAPNARSKRRFGCRLAASKRPALIGNIELDMETSLLEFFAVDLDGTTDIETTICKIHLIHNQKNGIEID